MSDGYLMTTNSRTSLSSWHFQLQYLYPVAARDRFIGAERLDLSIRSQPLDSGSLMAVKECQISRDCCLPIFIPRSETSRVWRCFIIYIVEYYGIGSTSGSKCTSLRSSSSGSLAALLEHGRIEEKDHTSLYDADVRGSGVLPPRYRASRYSSQTRTFKCFYYSLCIY